MSFKSKLPKRIFKEDEVLEKEDELKQYLFKDSADELRRNQIQSSFTAESDGCKEHMKEAENAFVEKSTDEEPMHDMRENSIEVDDFDELLKEDGLGSNSVMFGLGGEVCNNAIEQILSEAEDKDKNLVSGKGLPKSNGLFAFESHSKFRSVCFGLESETEDAKFLESIFQDEAKVIEKKAKMHLMGCKVTRIGKTRRKIKKARNNKRMARKRKFNEIKMLKKSLKSKIKILKVQKLKTQNELGVRTSDDKGWLPETHHKKYLKHLLFLVQENMKGKPRKVVDPRIDWKFAWVNFNEYIKTEDSVSYFHQRVLNLPERYVKKDLYNELGFLKQKKRKKSVTSEEETKIHAMFIKQSHSDQIYLIAYHFNEPDAGLDLHIDQIKLFTKAAGDTKLKVEGEDGEDSLTAFANSDERLRNESQSRTQLATPTLDSSELFDYNFKNDPQNELSSLFSPIANQEGKLEEDGYMEIEKENGLEGKNFLCGFDEPFKDFVMSGDENGYWKSQADISLGSKSGFLGENGRATPVQRRGFELEFDDFT